MNIGYVYDELMLLHEGHNELENSNRIIAIHNELSRRKYSDKMIKINSQMIKDDELALAHDPKYIEYINKIFALPEKELQKELNKMNSMFANKNSIISAKIAAGSTLNLMKHILNGFIIHGVAIVRPPGHHAHKHKGSGFCFYNNVAIAAKYGIESGKRIGIVDWDIHENDGVVNILKDTDNSLAISIHRYDHGQYYPGTGRARNTKNLLSIPLNKIAYDQDYYDIFDNIVIPKLREFNPDIIVVSAGFDAAEGDPLGEFHVTPTGYYNLTKQLLQFGKPIMLVLEGGYNLKSISDSMGECTRALLENIRLI